MAGIEIKKQRWTGKAHWFTAAFALLLLGLLVGICVGQARFRRRSDGRRGTVARSLRLAHGSRHICYETISHVRPPYPSVLIEGHRGAKSLARGDKGRSIMDGKRLRSLRRACDGQPQRRVE